MVVRVCRVIGILLLMAPAAFAAAEDPPAKLQFVHGHWTAWNPPDPATYPAGAETYVVARGDTLWGLAQQYYGDGYLWPQLWENNTWIRDAHWIYPGDVLLVTLEGVVDEAAEIVSVIDEEDLTSDPIFGESGSAPIPFALANTSDVFCFGYLGHENEEWPAHIASFEDTEVKYAELAIEQAMSVTIDDVIYIAGGTSAGIYPGEEYLVVHPGRLVEKPATGDVIGREYEYRGRVRILCADETEATAVVVQACSSILIGDKLKPVPTVPIPLAILTEFERHCEVPSGRLEGQIVNAKDHYYALGEGMMVQVDLGSEDQLVPGDFLTVWRPNAIEGYPRLVLGEIGIVATEPHSAIGKIVRMRYAMEVGDFVEAK